MPQFTVILPAAGKSSRFKDKEKKPFTNLDGRPVWLRTVEQFVTRADVCQCILVVAPEDIEMFRRRYTANIAFLNVKLATGGAERFESIANALPLLPAEADFVAVHDAVRPCITEALVSAVFAQAVKSGAAIPAIAIHDTIKQVDAQHKITATLPRKGLWLAQTPQTFRRDWLLDAYARRDKLGKDITDDAQLVEAAGHPVTVVEGAPTNIKITTKADLILAKAILEALPKPKPSGPAHPFADEQQMWGGRGS